MYRLGFKVFNVFLFKVQACGFKLFYRFLHGLGWIGATEPMHFYVVLIISAWLRMGWSSRIYAFLRGSSNFCASEDDLE